MSPNYSSTARVTIIVIYITKLLNEFYYEITSFESLPPENYLKDNFLDYLHGVHFIFGLAISRHPVYKTLC